MNNNAPRLATLHRGLEILKFLSTSSSGEGWANSEVATACNLDRASAFRFLQTLVNCGFAYKRDKRYMISCKLYSFAVASQRTLLLAAQPLINSLASETGCTTSLSLLEKDEAIPVILATGPSPVVVNSNLGRPVPLHASALGKALLASLSPEIRKKLVDSLSLDALTTNTIVDRKQLLSELDRTEQRGYATECEEYHLGVACVAMAISESDLMSPIVISISSLAKPMTCNKQFSTSLITQLRKTISDLKEQLGLVV